MGKTLDIIQWERRKEEDNFRDAAALAWLQGWMANPSVEDVSMEECSEKAFAMAEAMLAERRNRQNLRAVDR